MLENKVRSVPRPLVRTNQWFIVLSVLMTWICDMPWILAIPLGAGLMGLVFGINPIMRVASLFLRKPTKAYIPEEWDQQQFNQVIAVSCLTIGLISFLAGWKIIAYIFTAMVALAALIAILGFCIGCFIRFQWQQFMNKKSLNQ
jgi:hypothetical protein